MERPGPLLHLLIRMFHLRNYSTGPDEIWYCEYTLKVVAKNSFWGSTPGREKRLGVKRPEREAERSYPSSAETKKEFLQLLLHSPNMSSWRAA
jgi:hypothetical protein